MSDILKYEDLRLGEKAVEAFFDGKSPKEIEDNYPVYLNTRPVFGGLNVTDVAIAAQLAGLNSLFVGDTGTGKSQLAQDFFNYYYGGNVLEDGNGVKIRGRPELDIYEEVYTRLNIEKACREPTENVKGRMHFVDEQNRLPEVSQNQFFGLGDGFLEYKGMKLPLGRGDGFSVCVSTANLGNGEFQGTFETDKALHNRFPLILDFDYEIFKPTQEDRMVIDFLRAANPKIKEAPIRDISDKIVKVEREISQNALDPGLEVLAVDNFVKFGLENCQKFGSKEKNWPYKCQECPLNTDDSAICSLVRAPTTRTSQSMLKFAAALDYMIKLKNPQADVNSVDLAFKAFELTGAYQKLLNPLTLRVEYLDQNPKMMAEVVQSLKADFRKNEDFILTSLEEAQRGNKDFDDYFKGDLGNGDPGIGLGYNGIKKDKREKFEQVKPFTNERLIGLSWVKTAGELQNRIHSIRAKTLEEK